MAFLQKKIKQTTLSITKVIMMTKNVAKYNQNDATSWQIGLHEKTLYRNFFDVRQFIQLIK